MFKTQIVSICAKIVFSHNCRDVKNEVFENKIASFVFVFVLLQEKQRKKTKWKKANEKQYGKRQRTNEIVF